LLIETEGAAICVHPLVGSAGGSDKEKVVLCTVWCIKTSDDGMIMFTWLSVHNIIYTQTWCFHIITSDVSCYYWRGWLTEIPDIFYASSVVVAWISYYHSCIG
jgi:hypothetical protein